MKARKIVTGILKGIETLRANGGGTAELSRHGAEENPTNPAEPQRGETNAAAAQVLPPTVIRTTEKDWLARLTKAYRERVEVEMIDDAGIGIDPATQSLLQMGVVGKLTRKEWTAVSIAGGMTVFGASMVILAVLDPDPTSKLGLLVASGALLALTGGFETIRLLTRQRPPTITISNRGIHIDWN